MGDFGNTIRLINGVFAKIPPYWQRVIPCDIRIIATERKICTIDGCIHSPVAKLPGMKFDLVQATIVDGKKIFAHYDESKKSEGFFQYELLTMFGYAMCQDPKFVKLLNQHFTNTNNNQEMFADTFPQILFSSTHAKLKIKNPYRFDKMKKIEEFVSVLFI